MMTIKEFPIGCLVLTPVGRPARVIKHIFGARGDLPRCLVRYVDSPRKEELRITPNFLKRIYLEDHGK